MSMHLYRGQGTASSILLCHFYLIPLRQGPSLTLELDYHLVWPTGLLCPPSHSHTGVTGMWCRPAFYVATKGLNSGLYACTAISLPLNHLLSPTGAILCIDGILLIIKLIYIRNCQGKWSFTSDNWKLHARAGLILQMLSGGRKKKKRFLRMILHFPLLHQIPTYYLLVTSATQWE